VVVRGGLVERGVPVIKCKIINNNNNKIINENILVNHMENINQTIFLFLKLLKYYFYKLFLKTPQCKF
jgi:hypothetical protein